MSVEISLRPMTENDVDAEYVSWFNNSDGHLDFYTGSGRIYDREVILEDLNKGIETKRWFYHIIECEGKKIGNVKIGPIDLNNKTSDLVCFIGNRSYLGKGLASKAISIANEIAFKKYDIRRLHGGMYSSNIPSIKAYLRAGWIVEANLVGYYWTEGKSVDRVSVACFNKKYFDQ